MGDIISIRASEEIQAKFKEIAESGAFRNQSEFLAQLLTTYAAQETGIRVPTLESAISAVSELTNRINKVLVGAGETILLNQEKEKAQIEAIRLEAENRIKAAADESGTLKNEIAELESKLETKEKELADAQEHEKKLTFTLDDKAALIDSYRERIDSLETEISRQRVLVTEAEDDKAELDELRLKTKEQNVQIEHMTLEKDKALNDQKSFYTEKMNDQKSFYTEKIAATISEYEAAIRQKEFEISQAKNSSDKALNDLESKFRREIEERQTQYGKSIERYETKVFSLLQKLEIPKTQENQTQQ